jgi:hypothetical protein
MGALGQDGMDKTLKINPSVHSYIYLFGTLVGELKGDLETAQVEKGLDRHVVGRRQDLKERFAGHVILRRELLVPFLVHDLYKIKKVVSKV